MAATAAARRLTEAHRLAQVRLGVATVAAMRSVWSLLDLEDLDGTFDRYLSAAVPIIQGQRMNSARLAGNYLVTFKRLELGPQVSVPFTLADVADVEALSTSLLVTGPARLKSAAGRGVPLLTAASTAEASSAAAAMRHALDGGRDTINQTVQRDDQAIGWQRVTSASPCPFCRMLASRGPVYRSEGSAAFEPHDKCFCEPEPIYRDDSEWAPLAEEFQAQWVEAQRLAAENGELNRGTKNDALNAFRRYLSA